MTLVIETAPGVYPATDPQLSAALSGLGIPPESGRHEVLGGHHFHYFPVIRGVHQPDISEVLSRLGGVLAAYLKPDGSPP